MTTPPRKKHRKPKVALNPFALQECLTMRTVNERLVNAHRPGLQAVAESEGGGSVPDAKPQEGGGTPLPVKGATGKTINKLKGPTRFKLNTEIVKHVAAFEAEQFTLEQAAEYMTKVMGFEVSRKHIETSKNDTGIRWKVRNPRKGNTTKSSRVIAAAILDLYRRLGEVPPEEFTAWVNETHAPGWSRTGTGYIDPKGKNNKE